MFYVGILDSNEDGTVWGVRFPDVPGAVSSGATAEEAISDAAEALRDVLSYRTVSDMQHPPARTVAQILMNGEVAAGEATVLVPLLLDGGRVVRANLTFDADLLSAIDLAATQRGITRSAFLASAAREKIAAQR